MGYYTCDYCGCRFKDRGLFADDKDSVNQLLKDGGLDIFTGIIHAGRRAAGKGLHFCSEECKRAYYAGTNSSSGSVAADSSDPYAENTFKNTVLNTDVSGGTENIRTSLDSLISLSSMTKKRKELKAIAVKMESGVRNLAGTGDSVNYKYYKNKLLKLRLRIYKGLIIFGIIILMYVIVIIANPQTAVSPS